jgi:hypothetical protein
VHGTEGWTATLIRSVVEGSRYQSNKTHSLKHGLRDDDRKCGVEKRAPVAERKHDGEEKQHPNKRK